MVVETGERSGALRWVAGAVAIIVTLAIAAGLVFYRISGNRLPSGPAVGKASVSNVTFTCRLPVLAGAAAGFVSFPDGAVTIDKTQVSPGNIKGAYGYTYDPQVRKWVPVPRSALSPDGRSYAYLAQTTGVPGQMASLSLHTHDIVSGSDHVLWQGQGSPMGPSQIAWLASGLYFSAVLYSADNPQGPTFAAIYVADLNHAGTPRRVGPNPPPQPPSPGQPYYAGPDQFPILSEGAAWGVGQRVPAVPVTADKASMPGMYGPDRILRMDLRDGSVSTWYTVTGTALVSLVGVDAKGEPIISLFEPPTVKKALPDSYVPPPVTLLLLTGPNQTATITSGNPDFHLGSQPSADAHGIWLGSWDSIWLYTPAAGLRQVASIPTGIFPSPTPPPGAYPNKGTVASGGRPAMPAYMQGTLMMVAGPCA